MEITNAPASLGDFIAFRENPFNVAITLPTSYPIVAPVTAELWFRDVKQVDQIVPVTVTGQKIEFTFTVVQLRAMVKAKFYILFNGEYVFFAPIIATMGGAIPSAREITVSLEPIGEVLVSVYSDKATVGAAQDAANIAKGYRDEAYDFMIEAQNASTGAVNAAGTFNASTGQAFLAATPTTPSQTFTPTASSTRPKGEFFDINAAGTTNITGSSISVAVGGRMRSNGVGVPWTYVPPTDTAYAFYSGQFSQENLANPDNFTEGRLIQSNGAAVITAPWSTLDSLPVTPGDTLYMNTAENVGFNYGCWFTSGGTPITAEGWNGPGVKTRVVPATAAFFTGTFKTAFIDSVSVYVGEDLPFIPHDEYLSRNIKIKTSDLIQVPDANLVTDAELEVIQNSETLVNSFDPINLANPASFLGRYMQANGTPVTNSAWRQTGSIAVTPGQFLAMNTNADTGWQYGCFFTSLGAAMPSYGWNNVNTKNVQVPAGAGIFIGSFPAANAGSAMLEVVASIATPPSGFVEYGKLFSNLTSIPAKNVAFDKERQTLTSSEKASLAFVTDLSDKMVRYEAKGWIQKINLVPTAARPDMEEIAKIIFDPLTDFVPFCENGSIDTGGMGTPQYCPYTPDSHLWPENCREDNLWKKWVGFIWKNYYPGQRHARFDTPGFFTITGSVTIADKNIDDAWGHVFPVGSGSAITYWDRYYRVITPNTPSDVAATSFPFPANFQKAAWIFSGSHLSGALTISVSSGNGAMQAWDKATSSWVELNGYVFNTATPDEFKAVAFLDSTQIRKDQPSMILKLRRTPNSSATTTPTVTGTMAAGKRIEHWGLYYTSQSNLFIPINHAKASHTLGALQPFHEFGLNKIEPNVYILGCPTINEMQQIYNGNTFDLPTVYSARFTNYLTNYIVGLPYIKATYCRIRGFSRGQGVYGPTNDQSVVYAKTSTVNGWTYMNYKNQLVKDLYALKATRPAGSFVVADHTSAYVELIDRIAEDKGISKRQAHYNDVINVDGECAMADATHENELGSTAGFRKDVPYWIF